MRRVCHLALIASLTFVCAYLRSTQAQVPDEKPATKITLTVEKEGLSGLISQAGTDLTDTELATLRTLIEKKIVGLELKHELVPDTYEETHLFLSVVAEKFVSGGKTHFAVSSALSIGKVQTTVGSLTHDVIIEPSIQTAAQAVVSYLSGVELRGITGSINPGFVGDAHR